MGDLIGRPDPTFGQRAGGGGGGGGFSKPSLTRVWTHSGGSGRTHSFPLERGEFHGKLQNCRMHSLSNPFTVTQILGYHRPDTCRIRPLHEFSFLRTPLRSSVSLRWKYEYRSDGHQRNATEQTNAKTLCDRRRPEPWLRGVSPHLQTPPPPPRNPAASFLVAGGPWEHQHTRVASLCIALLGTFCAATTSGKIQRLPSSRCCVRLFENVLCLLCVHSGGWTNVGTVPWPSLPGGGPRNPSMMRVVLGDSHLSREFHRKRTLHRIVLTETGGARNSRISWMTAMGDWRVPTKNHTAHQARRPRRAENCFVSNTTTNPERALLHSLTHLCVSFVVALTRRRHRVNFPLFFPTRTHTPYYYYRPS